MFVPFAPPRIRHLLSIRRIARPPAPWVRFVNYTVGTKRAACFFPVCVKIYDAMMQIARCRLAAPAALVLLLAGGLALGQGKDSLLGAWVLDRGNSVFDPDTTLESRSVAFEAKNGAVGFVQKTVTDRGNTVQINFEARYDGKDVPITGSQMDTVSLQRIDANTVERTGKIGGKVVETATMKVSSGGKTLTIVTKGSIDGVDYSSTQVYQKQ